MEHLKKIWKKSYLGQIQHSDPKFFLTISLILTLYIFIHIFRLEMYPLYMFAMFSKQETPRELYHVYEIYDGKNQKDLTEMDYRAYTVLMNTVTQYDQIIENDMSHPESGAIDKFVDRLHLDKTAIRFSLKSSFQFEKSKLDQEFGDWIASKLSMPQENLKIIRASYNWTEKEPSLNRKVVIYGSDQ